MSTGEERLGSCSACEGASFIRDTFQRCFQHFKSTSHWLLLKVFQLNHFWMSVKLTLEELAILLKMQGNLRKIIAACNVSKNAASLQVLFCHILRTVSKDFRSFSKFFQSISRTKKKKVTVFRVILIHIFPHSDTFYAVQVILYHSSSCVFLKDTPNERWRFSTQ